jgi:hypothetical protein
MPSKPKSQAPKDPWKVGGGPINQNQHAPIFYDRRTKRNRDRSNNTRNAIDGSATGN